MGNIGITGSNGFVGSHLSQLLKEQGHHVDNFTSERYRKEGFGNFVKDKDVIYHFAAVNRADSGDDYINGNYELTKDLVEKIKKHNPGCRIIFSSTVQVYGTQNGTITEDAEPEPEGIYAKSKLWAEDYIKESGLDYVILRISNVYGASARPFYNSVVATFLHLAKKDEPLKVFGSGEQKRDYIFIEDVVNALGLAKKIKAGVYNCSTGEMITINQLISNLEKAMNKKLKIEKKEGSEEENVPVYDNTKLLNTGWKPEYNFEEGIKKCL